jgi:hypothetical protein
MTTVSAATDKTGDSTVRYDDFSKKFLAETELAWPLRTVADQTGGVTPDRYGMQHLTS